MENIYEMIVDQHGVSNLMLSGLGVQSFDLVEVGRRQISRRLVKVEKTFDGTIEHWEITIQIQKQRRLNSAGKNKLKMLLLLNSLASMKSSIKNDNHSKDSKEKDLQTSQGRRKLIYNELRKRFSHNATIGMMANIQVESGGTYDWRTKQIKGPGYGIFQFDFHKPYYYKFLSQNKLQDSIQSQIQYMAQTINGKKTDIIGSGNARKLNKILNDPTKTPEEIAEIFCNDWERPNPQKAHLSRRIAACQTIIKALGK